MWIIPKNLDVSACVRDTLDSNWDSNELSQILERSAMWRSKPSLARTWLQRLKRVSWMRHLSGRTLRPSMECHFVTGYTSSLRVIPASRLALPASKKEQTTPDTFGRILKDSLRQLDLFGVSSRTLEDTLQSDTPQFIEAYEIWVTKLRRDCLQRQRSARLTRENDYLSWLTPQTMDYLPERCPEALERQFATQRKGRTTPATLREQINPANWPTPAHRDYRNQHAENSEAFKSRLKNPRGVNLVEFLQRQVGLLAPDSPSTNGKSRELWVTIQARDWKGRQGQSYKGLATDLPEQVKGKLNPDWVEQLMGLKVHWTKL